MTVYPLFPFHSNTNASATTHTLCSDTHASNPFHSNANASTTTHTPYSDTRDHIPTLYPLSISTPTPQPPPTLRIRTRATISPPSTPFPFQRQHLSHHPHSVFGNARPYPHLLPPFHSNANANASATTHASSPDLCIQTRVTISPPSLPFSVHRQRLTSGADCFPHIQYYHKACHLFSGSSIFFPNPFVT